MNIKEIKKGTRKVNFQKFVSGAGDFFRSNWSTLIDAGIVATSIGLGATGMPIALVGLTLPVITGVSKLVYTIDADDRLTENALDNILTPSLLKTGVYIGDKKEDYHENEKQRVKMLVDAGVIPYNFSKKDLKNNRKYKPCFIQLKGQKDAQLVIAKKIKGGIRYFPFGPNQQIVTQPSKIATKDQIEDYYFPHKLATLDEIKNYVSFRDQRKQAKQKKLLAQEKQKFLKRG